MTHDTAPKPDFRTANALARLNVTNSATRAIDMRVSHWRRQFPRATSSSASRFCMEFVKAAREKLDRDNWDYLIGAAETETTYARNRLALDSPVCDRAGAA